MILFKTGAHFMPRIMIVDDDVTIQLELEEYLKHMNHDVVGIADTGLGAVEMALELKPDLILMDVVMPGEIDGISAAQRIKRETDAAVVFITGFGDPEYLDRAKEVEPFDYVMKPFDEKEIRGVIEIVLSRRNLELKLKSAHDRLERTNLDLQREIEARKKTEKALRESEERWQFALEGSRNGVWDWNALSNEVFFSKQWKEMLGYDEDEISNHLDEWESRLHPDDKERCHVDLNRHLNGQTPYYENEHRLLCKDGSYKWILDRGKVVSWTENNKPLRVIGTHTDITERKQDEDALESSQRRLSQIINFLPDATMVIDLEGKVIAWNKAMEVMTGIKTEDILGKGNYEYAIPFYGTRRPVLIDLVGKWNKEIEGKYQYVKKEGESLVSETYDPLVKPGGYLQNKASLLYDRNGEPIGAIESIRDITERKVAEAALKENRNFIDKIINTAPNLVYIYDVVENRNVYSNAGVEKILGFNSREVQDMGEQLFSTLIHPDDIRIVKGHHERLKESVEGDVFHIDYRIKNRDGEYRILKSWDTVFKRRNDGGVKQIIGLAVDVTEQRHNQEMLKFEKERAQQYLDVAGVMLLAMNMDGKVTLINPKGCEILGYPQDEIVGKDWLETFIFPENVEAVGNVFDQIVSGNMDSVRYYENPVRAGDGKKRLIAWNNSVLKDSSGNIVGLFSSGEDITEKNRTEAEREQLRDQLTQVQKMEAIATLAGGIAHDYNNLLSIVMGNLSMVLEDIDRHSVAADFLREAEKASLKARDLTHEFLTLSHGGHPHREKGSIVDLLKEIPEQVRAEKGNECILSIQDGLWPVEYDSKQMQYAISNVFANAVEAIPQGGTITLQAENQIIDNNGRHCAKPLKKGRYVVVSVIDEGRGISEEHLNQIFDPYFSTKERGVQKGMGLGLAIAYAAIKKHEGHITVNSKTGVGTTVTIYLPAMGGEMKSAPRDDAEAPSAINHHPSSNRRILVMDDEEMLRTLAQKMLDRLGYEAATVKDGDEAIKEYKRKMDSGESFDGVILDLTIKGGMGGKEAIKELIKIAPDVKAVVSSGYFNDPVMANYKEHGFRGVLAKPFQKADLERVLKEILG